MMSSKLNSPFRALVVAQQDALALSDTQLAEAAGFQDATGYREMLNGDRHIPILRIPALAQVLQLDCRRLLRMSMQEEMPTFLKLIDEHLRPDEVTEDEARDFAKFRDVTTKHSIGAISFYDTKAKTISKVRLP